jgi:PAS domain S-box-containing protein
MPDSTKPQPLTPEIANKLAARLAGADEAVAVGSRSGVIEWTNSAWARITGWALEDDVNKPVTRLLGEIAPDPAVIEFIEASYLAGRRAVVELPIETPDGSTRWIHLEVDPYRDATGDISDFVCIAHDITERRLAEQALERHDRAQLGLDAAEAAHFAQPPTTDAAATDVFVMDAIEAVSELRQSLARIAALGGLPGSGADLTPRDDLTLAAEHARMTRTVARLEQSMTHSTPTPSATDLSVLLRSACRSLAGELPRRATIDTDFEEAPRLAVVDAARVSELTVDLLRSSLEAIGDEWGTLSVTTGTTTPGEVLRSPTYHRSFGGTLRDTEPRAFIEIHDTALALMPNEIARLNQPALPLAESKRVRVLLRARALLAAQGGELQIASMPGCGTRVLILLPSTSLGLA